MRGESEWGVRGRIKVESKSESGERKEGVRVRE